MSWDKIHGTQAACEPTDDICEKGEKSQASAGMMMTQKLQGAENW